MSKRLSRQAAGSLAASVAFCGLWASPRVGDAQTYNWQAYNGDTWSDPAAWDAGTPVSSPTTVLNFGVSNGSVYTATDDLPSPGGTFTVNSININTTGTDASTGAIFIAPVGAGSLGSTIALAGTAPTLSINGFGGSNITSSISYGNGAVVTNNSAGQVTIGSPTPAASLQTFNGTNTFINNGTGTLVIVDADSNASFAGGSINLNLVNNNPNPGSFGVPNFASNVTGTINVVNGYVQFQGNTGGDLFSNNLILNVDAGGTFDFNANPETMGGIMGAGDVYLNSANVGFAMPGNRTFSGTFYGTGNVTQEAVGTLTLSGTNTYSGTTTVEAGGEIAAGAANAFSPNSEVSISAGQGTVVLNGYSETIAGLDGGLNTDQINLAGGTTLTISDNSTTTHIYNGGLSGGGNLVFGLNGVTVGTEELLGSNTYTGTTIVNSGTLVLGAGNLTGGSGITIATGATLALSVPTSTSFTAPISGGGTFLSAGPGTLTFSTANVGASLAGIGVLGGAVVLNDTTVNGGQLGTSPALSIDYGSLYLLGNGSAASAQGFSGLTTTGNGTIGVVSGNNQSATLSLGAITRTSTGGSINFIPSATGSGSAVISTSTANTNGILGDWAVVNGTDWASATGSSAPYPIAALPAGSYTSNTWASSNHTNVGVGTTTNSITAGSSTYDLRFNQNASDTVSLAGASTLNGGGVLITPTVAGNLSKISGGSLNVASGTDLIFNQYDTSSTGTLIVSSVIANNAGSTPVTQNANIAASGGSQTVTVASTAGITLGMTVTAPGEILSSYNAKVVGIPSSTQVTIAYNTTPIANTGVTLSFTPETNVIKTGPGAMQLTGSNTIAGLLAVDNGLLSISSTANAGIGSYNATKGVNGSSAIYWDGGTVEFTGSSGFSPGVGNQPWIFGTNGGTIVVDSGNTVTRTGYGLYGTGNLTKLGLGTFSVGSDGSPFTGQINIDAGIFRVTSSQLKSAGNVTIANGAQYMINDNGVATFNFGPGSVLSLTGDGPASQIANSNAGAYIETVQSSPTEGPTSTLGNEIYLGGTYARVGDYTNYGFESASIFTGIVIGPGALIKDGPGTLTLSNSLNNYGYGAGSLAATIVSDGYLVAGATNCLPQTGLLQFGETVATDNSVASEDNAGTFDLDGFNVVVGGIINGDNQANAIVNSSNTAATLTINYNNTSTPAMFAGMIGNGASQNGLSIVYGGTGEQQLQGSSTYTGGTTVNSGTLTGTVAGAFGAGTVTVSPTGATGTLVDNATLNVDADSAIAPTAALIVNSETSDGSFGVGKVIFNDAAPTIASLSGNGNVVLNNGSLGTALTLGGSGSATFTGVISDLGTGNGSLTATGSGTVTLAGTSTYGGSTAVSGGTLNITGALTKSASISATGSSNLVLAGTNALPSTATVNVGATANLFVNNSQSISALASSGNSTFSAGTSIVGLGSGLGTGTGTTGFASGGISGTGTLTVTGTANLYASTITQKQLTIAGSNTVTIADSAAPGNTSATSVVTDISNAGTLDLNNNDLIVMDTTQYSTVKNLIVSAFDGGAWDKPGITSSSARANAGAYGLGYAQASTIGSTSFDGQSFTDAVLVKYTLLGDTQLRGTVGIGDYDTVLSNYGTAQDWSGGDFHYGGVVGIGDYDDVLSNFGAHASGNLAAGPSLTRSVSPAASINPDLAKTDLKLEVNTTTGDVYVVATASVAFTGYTISDPTAHLLGGSTSPDPDKLLSVSAGNGGNTNVYETSGTYVDWFKITETASQVAEGQQQNGFGTHSSRDDTINIPAGGTIDFGDIYNTAAAQQDLTFDFAEAGTEPTNGPTYYGAEVDYISSSTPEPASASLLAIGALGMLGRRRRRRPAAAVAD